MAKAAEIVGLDCAAPVREGAALVLRTRLEEMCGWRAAALDWSAPKGVHDMRVASRRLRSAARDFAPYLAERPPRRRLRELAAALGAVRNEDVGIAALEELAGEAAPEIAPGLRDIIAERAGRRERARAALATLLAESAVAALREQYLRRLEGAAAKAQADERGPSARPFKRAGRKIIKARLTELRTHSSALTRPHAIRRLHRLRIAAKRLRYALDLFVPCWGAVLHEAAREVARLQKSLGELHDCDDWIAELSARLCASVETQTDAGDAVERRATYWLLSKVIEQRAGHLRAALERWDDWEATNFLARIDAALNGPDTTIEMNEALPAEASAS